MASKGKKKKGKKKEKEKEKKNNLLLAHFRHEGGLEKAESQGICYKYQLFLL